MRARLAEQQRQQRELTDAVAAVQQQRTENTAALAELAAASEETLRQWNALHLTEAPADAPSESELVAFRGATVAQAGRLRELRAQHQRALTGFERWRDNQLLTATEDRLRGALATSGSEDLAQHRTWLDYNENRLRLELAQAERARQLAGRLKETMQQEAESYSSTVLRPLNERISALHAMLSPSHEFAFDFNVRQHKSRTDFRLHMSVAEDEEPLDPYLPAQRRPAFRAQSHGTPRGQHGLPVVALARAPARRSAATERSYSRGRVPRCSARFSATGGLSGDHFHSRHGAREFHRPEMSWRGHQV